MRRSAPEGEKRLNVFLYPREGEIGPFCWVMSGKNLLGTAMGKICGGLYVFNNQ